MTDHNQDLVKTLRRIFYCNRIINSDLELVFMTIGLAPNFKQRVKRMISDIEWMRQQLATASPNSETRDIIMANITSEHAKDLTEWLDMGINCKNLEEVTEVLQSAKVNVSEKEAA
ncbi:MAG: hypothetical protein EOP56_09235 [Sphingobacteriales bacterium]|nr:MAG: hypothetical protein EOP56_09235 [Sphingobacteriales bacterium]